MQLNHYNTKFETRNFPIVLITDNVSNAPNVGAIFRISDAFGIEKLHLCGTNLNLGRKMFKTSRATEKNVVFELNKDAFDLLPLR